MNYFMKLLKRMYLQNEMQHKFLYRYSLHSSTFTHEA